MKKIFLFSVFVLLRQAFGQSSPCPNVFSYVNNEGRIKLKDLNFVGNKVKLDVALSVRGQLNTQNTGKIILQDQPSVYNKIANNEPLDYRVLFPPNLPVPNILKISVNERAICQGPAASGSFVTSVYLTHTLNLAIAQSARPIISSINLVPSIPQKTTLPPIQYIKPPAGDGCGISVNIANRVSFGSTSARGEWPWLVALYSKAKGQLKFFCGSSLVSKKALVTAAHCIHNVNEKDVTAFLGKYDLGDLYEDNSVFHSVSRLIIHPDYGQDFQSYDADIGIVLLKNTVAFDMFTGPICLWNKESNYDHVLGLKGTVAGWGYNENVEEQQIAQQFEATIISRDDCVRRDERFDGSTTERLFCADGFGSAPCQGDSGGGFYILANGKWNLRGVVSHGISSRSSRSIDCDDTKPAAYTDVAQFIDWIKKNI